MSMESDKPLWDDCCWVLGHDVLEELRDQEPIGESSRTWKWFPSLDTEQTHTVATRLYRWEVEFENVADDDGKPYEDGLYAFPVEVGDYGRAKAVWIGDPEPVAVPLG